jgi:hypothetical protein
MELKVGKLLIHHDYGDNKKFALVIEKKKTRNKWIPSITILFIKDNLRLLISRADAQYSYLECNPNAEF